MGTPTHKVSKDNVALSTTAEVRLRPAFNDQGRAGIASARAVAVSLVGSATGFETRIRRDTSIPNWPRLVPHGDDHRTED